MHYFVLYLLRCTDNSLYCGVTKDVNRRLKEHNSGVGSAYVRSRGGGTLIYKEQHLNLGSALRREWEIKKWSKDKKEKFIRQKKYNTKTASVNS